MQTKVDAYISGSFLFDRFLLRGLKRFNPRYNSGWLSGSLLHVYTNMAVNTSSPNGPLSGRWYLVEDVPDWFDLADEPETPAWYQTLINNAAAINPNDRVGVQPAFYEFSNTNLESFYSQSLGDFNFLLNYPYATTGSNPVPSQFEYVFAESAAPRGNLLRTDKVALDVKDLITICMTGKIYSNEVVVPSGADQGTWHNYIDPPAGNSYNNDFKVLFDPEPIHRILSRDAVVNHIVEVMNQGEQHAQSINPNAKVGLYVSPVTNASNFTLPENIGLSPTGTDEDKAIVAGLFRTGFDLCLQTYLYPFQMYYVQDENPWNNDPWSIEQGIELYYNLYILDKKNDPTFNSNPMNDGKPYVLAQPNRIEPLRMDWVLKLCELGGATPVGLFSGELIFSGVNLSTYANNLVGLPAVGDPLPDWWIELMMNFMKDKGFHDFAIWGPLTNPQYEETTFESTNIYQDQVRALNKMEDVIQKFNAKNCIQCIAPSRAYFDLMGNF